MSEKIIKDVLKDVALKQSEAIYNDGLKGATKEGGEALQTIVGLFNNVILFPVKKLNMVYKYKLEEFSVDLENRASKIDVNNLVNPPLNIIGPTIESLKYTIDTKDLREMYINLLVSSMDASQIQFTHPSYVDIIKQLSSLDAQILKRIRDLNNKLICSRVDFVVETGIYANAMPQLFVPDILSDDDDPFLVSSSLLNLIRLGLISHHNVGLKNRSYSFIESHPYVITRKKLFDEIGSYPIIEIFCNKETLQLSNFGENFSIACIDDN